MALVNLGLKHVLITFCFLECLLLSGFIFGWSSLVYVFKDLGYFLTYCNHTIATVNVSERNETLAVETVGVTILPSGHCHEQDAALDLVFTVATVGSMLCILPLGVLIDCFGITIGRMVSCILLCAGILLAGFTPASLSELLFPACMSIATGGILLLVVDIKLVADLKLRRKGTAIAFLDSAFDSSAFVTVVIQIAHNIGLQYRLSFVIVLSLSIITCITTVCHILYGRRTVLTATPATNNDVTIESTDDPKPRTNRCMENTVEQRDDNITSPPRHGPLQVISPTYQISKRFPTLQSAMGSSLFISLLIWMGILHLRWTFFIGAFNLWIERLTHYDKILGNRDPLRDLKNCRLAFLLTSIIFSLFTVCVAIPVLELQFLSFILLSFGRCFLYSLVSAFITFTFPTQFLGRLYEMTSLVNAAMTVVQFPLFVAIENSNTGFYVNLAFIPAVFLTFIHPIYLHFYVKNLKPTLTGTSSTIRLDTFENGRSVATISS